MSQRTRARWRNFWKKRSAWWKSSAPTPTTLHRWVPVGWRQSNVVSCEAGEAYKIFTQAYCGVIKVIVMVWAFPKSMPTFCVSLSSSHAGCDVKRNDPLRAHSCLTRSRRPLELAPGLIRNGFSTVLSQFHHFSCYMLVWMMVCSQLSRWNTANILLVAQKKTLLIKSECRAVQVAFCWAKVAQLEICFIGYWSKKVNSFVWCAYRDAM